MGPAVRYARLHLQGGGEPERIDRCKRRAPRAVHPRRALVRRSDRDHPRFHAPGHDWQRDRPLLSGLRRGRDGESRRGAERERRDRRAQRAERSVRCARAGSQRRRGRRDGDRRRKRPRRQPHYGGGHGADHRGAERADARSGSAARGCGRRGSGGKIVGRNPAAH